MIFLRKCPILYNSIIQMYFMCQPIHIKEMIFGSKAREKDWVTRHLRKGNDWYNMGDDWVESYWNSRNHSHRAFLVDKIASYNPQSILEIGCNCAPNLYLLARRFPDIAMYGVDINPMAIKYGKEMLAKENITNVRLEVGNLSQLPFHTHEFDVVFTDAVLIYVLPRDVGQVIEDMVRISRKVLILLERDSGEDTFGVYRYGCWERDYVGLLKRFVSEKQISITKITKGIWDEERWQETGALIEVRVDEEMAIP
jgi:ubiquinone/menaquinone biosynthesis C-methylase UbiE